MTTTILYVFSFSYPLNISFHFFLYFISSLLSFSTFSLYFFTLFSLIFSLTTLSPIYFLSTFSLRCPILSFHLLSLSALTDYFHSPLSPSTKLFFYTVAFYFHSLSPFSHHFFTHHFLIPFSPAAFYQRFLAITNQIGTINKRMTYPLDATRIQASFFLSFRLLVSRMEL